MMSLLLILLSIRFILPCHGESGAVLAILAKEGESVILDTGVKKNQQDRIRWYFNDIRIAQINGDPTKTCTDVQCNEGNENFRDRLKLDHQTGSLTIMNIRNTHSGKYTLLIKGNEENIFHVTVHDDPDAHRNQVKKNQGESVTFNPGVRRNLILVLKYLLNDFLIAEITVNQSQICTDVQCKERFNDRLKLDHESASLTITNTRSTDSGNYTSEIFISSDRRFSITREKIFRLAVISLSQLPGGAVAVMVVVLVGVVVVAGVIYHHCHRNDEAAPQIEAVAYDPSNTPSRNQGRSDSGCPLINAATL